MEHTYRNVGVGRGLPSDTMTITVLTAQNRAFRPAAMTVGAGTSQDPTKVERLLEIAGKSLHLKPGRTATTPQNDTPGDTPHKDLLKHPAAAGNTGRKGIRDRWRTFVLMSLAR